MSLNRTCATRQDLLVSTNRKRTLTLPNAAIGERPTQVA